MRRFSLWWIAPSALLAVAGRVCGQAGRYIPIPSGGGGGMPFVPHGGNVGGYLFVLATILVAVVGVVLGQALGRQCSPEKQLAVRADFSDGTAAPGFASVPAMDTLILSASEVAAKEEETKGLLQQLASRDPLFEPTSLRDGLGRLFHLVEKCWQARDYGPLHDLLAPGILAKHEALLLSMRRHAEINRVEDVRITRFEFVHVFCPCDAVRQEVTALITFEARVYFVNEVTSAFLRSSRQVGLYQEFWTFRRHESAWRLRTIEQSHESDRLQAENQIEETPAGFAPEA
jgi:predicted lipid-binding transport protein (Tim44 family)